MSTLAAYSATQPRTLTRVLKAEVHPSFTRRDAILLAGDGASRDVVIGEVAGRRLFGTATGAVVKGAGVGGGTGDGGLGSITKGAAVKKGVYTLKCITEAGNAGTFSVFDPEGLRLPDATVAVAYAHPQINFTISDGANDFDLTDAFSITVAEGDQKVTAIDFDAVDGSQLWAGIFSKNTSAPDGIDASTQLVDKMALLAAEELIWPEDTTDDQKAVALALASASFIEVAQLG
tara:strand:- start:18199 stop:18897 length:699 start_codon:yes stop_codon:yes gene_type:complete